jgi:hypothetical protein
MDQRLVDAVTTGDLSRHFVKGVRIEHAADRQQRLGGRGRRVGAGSDGGSRARRAAGEGRRRRRGRLRHGGGRRWHRRLLLRLAANLRTSSAGMLISPPLAGRSTMRSSLIRYPETSIDRPSRGMALSAWSVVQARAGPSAPGFGSLASGARIMMSGPNYGDDREGTTPGFVFRASGRRGRFTLCRTPFRRPSDSRIRVGRPCGQVIGLGRAGSFRIRLMTGSASASCARTAA